MVSASKSRPFKRSSSRQPSLTSTFEASQTLKIPGRTLRRWTQQRGLGLMVAGRRLLMPEDLRLLELLRDGSIG
jgi:hypothetical protein